MKKVDSLVPFASIRNYRWFLLLCVFHFSPLVFFVERYGGHADPPHPQPPPMEMFPLPPLRMDEPEPLYLLLHIKLRTFFSTPAARPPLFFFRVLCPARPLRPGGSILLDRKSAYLAFTRTSQKKRPFLVCIQIALPSLSLRR